MFKTSYISKPNIFEMDEIGDYLRTQLTDART